MAGRKVRKCASTQVPSTKGIESEATGRYGTASGTGADIFSAFCLDFSVILHQANLCPKKGRRKSDFRFLLFCTILSDILFTIKASNSGEYFELGPSAKHERAPKTLIIYFVGGLEIFVNYYFMYVNNYFKYFCLK